MADPGLPGKSYRAIWLVVARAGSGSVWERLHCKPMLVLTSMGPWAAQQMVTLRPAATFWLPVIQPLKETGVVCKSVGCDLRESAGWGE